MKQLFVFVASDFLITIVIAVIASDICLFRLFKGFPVDFLWVFL